MEAMAAKTDGGTFMVAIDRIPTTGSIGRLELHASFCIAAERSDTEGIRHVLGDLAEELDHLQERELMARLYTLARELEEQDKGRRTP